MLDTQREFLKQPISHPLSQTVILPRVGGGIPCLTGKPPKKTQFKKSQSGNPKGRSKGSKNTMAMASDIFEESIMLRENGNQKHVSKKEAMLRRLMQKAMEGDIKAMEKVLSMSKEIERRNDRDEAIMEYIHKRISDGLCRAQRDPGTLTWVSHMKITM